MFLLLLLILCSFQVSSYRFIVRGCLKYKQAANCEVLMHFVKLLTAMSEPVKVFLCGYLSILVIIITALGIHIVDHTDGKKVKFADGNAKLHTPKQKQWGCHLTLCWMKFFLVSTSVFTFSPHNSISCGRI